MIICLVLYNRKKGIASDNFSLSGGQKEEDIPLEAGQAM
jgi:hypothetical protein